MPGERLFPLSGFSTLIPDSIYTGCSNWPAQVQRFFTINTFRGPCHSNTRLLPFLKIQQTMNLTELKQKSVPELLDIAQEMGLDNLARSR
ncbi:MAG: Rho termination factor N-terminal domain-containing protein, partial [Marinobacter sp.]